MKSNQIQVHNGNGQRRLDVELMLTEFGEKHNRAPEQLLADIAQIWREEKEEIKRLTNARKSD